MGRRIVGPFPGLQNLPDVDVNTADDLDILERMDVLNQCLAEAGCNCVGHAKGLQEAADDPGSKHRDEYFGGDISELVCRCTPHDIDGRDSDGAVVQVSVRIKIETLTVEVDDNNELCAWTYEES